MSVLLTFVLPLKKLCYEITTATTSLYVPSKVNYTLHFKGIKY